MHCIHINTRNALLIIVSILFNNIQRTQMVGQIELPSKAQLQRDGNVNYSDPFTVRTTADAIYYCPVEMQCKDMTPPCFECDFNLNCIYGDSMNTTCKAHHMVKCQGERQFQKSLICKYCYQTAKWEHTCDYKGNCNSANTPAQYYRTNCTANKDILCLGFRTFNKNVKCNWTGGYRWSTALILSVTLGGFGADRFYLGHWQEGIGKLFSFGGLGVWTLIDVILISLHYLGPADGSLYI